MHSDLALLGALTTGTNNCAFGNSPLGNMTTGTDNCAFGFVSMFTATGNHNCAMGSGLITGYYW